MERKSGEPSMGKVLRLAEYARVSDPSQAEEDKVSLQEQFADMDSYCKSKGPCEIVRYRDIGPGWSMKRPGFREMLEDARQGKLDGIVCWKFDRISRGMYPAAALMEVMENHRITLEGVKEGIDSKYFGLLAALGKIEIDNFKERSAMGRRGAAKQGRAPSKLPYGYRRGKDARAEIVEEEAEVVRRIFHWYVHEGLGATLIGELLTAEGVPSAKSAVRWHQARVNHILGHTAYKGILQFGKAVHVATDEGRIVYPQPPETWIDVPVPTIIDPAIWKRAQELKKERLSKSKRNTKVLYILQHLAKCGKCGRRLGCRSNWGGTHRRNGKEYTYTASTPSRYYHCYGLYQKIRCREHPYIRAGELEELVWEAVKEVLENPQLVVAGMEAMDSGDDCLALEEIAQAERELKKIEEDNERVVRFGVSGRFTEKEYDRERALIKRRFTAANKKLDEYRTRQAAAAHLRGLSSTVTAWAEKISRGLSSLGDEQQKELLTLVLEDVVVGADNRVVITLAIPFDESMSFASEVATPRFTP